VTPAASREVAGYDLLVCDLDGTLIDGSMTLEPSLATAFRRAAERGLAVSIATGRMPAAADRYRDELGITAPVIYYNGALVRDGSGRPDLVSLTLPRGVLARAWAVFSNAPVHPIFYRDGRLHCVEKTFEIRRYCDEEGLRVEVVDDPAGFLELGAFIKTLLIAHPRDLDVVREELTPVVAEHGRLVRTRRDYLEIIPVTASKGAALARLEAQVFFETHEAVRGFDLTVEMAAFRIGAPQCPVLVLAHIEIAIAPAARNEGDVERAADGIIDNIAQ